MSGDVISRLLVGIRAAVVRAHSTMRAITKVLLMPRARPTSLPFVAALERLVVPTPIMALAFRALWVS
jgi:hypothetical protein